jgi:hypothetical protein
MVPLVDIHGRRIVKYVHIETKTRSGKLSKVQEAAHARLEKFGAYVFVVRSANDLAIVIATC